MAAPVFSPLITDTLVILGAAGVVIPLFARFRITPVIGFLLVGIAVGPSGLGRLAAMLSTLDLDTPGHGLPGGVLGGWLDGVLVQFAHIGHAGRSHFARFGVILLLFSGGLELSFDRLRQMRDQVFGLGALELLANAALLTAGLLASGEGGGGALALGLALAMSSTALVPRITRAGTPVGRATLAMLLFEDLALIPIIVVLDALAPHGSANASAHDPLRLLHTLGLGSVAIGALLLFGRYLLPRLFAQAARTKSPELFLATSLLVVVVSAMATAGAGLSPLVGAMIAGLLIAETEYHAEVEAMTAPFKGLALGVFLIAIGMSLDLGTILAHIVPILLATAGVLALKALVTSALLHLMGARPGTAAEAGILMASPSETTLIVISAGTVAHLISPATADFWQTVTALGLIVTPGLAAIGRRLGHQVEHAIADPGELVAAASEATGHAVVIGFGRVGRLIADMLIAHDKAYLGIDADAELVASGQRAGYAVAFGDVARGTALARLGLDSASAAILTMDQPQAAQRLVKQLRAQHPKLPIIARARDAAHAAGLYRAGATLAIPEALEASLQLSEALLVEMGVPMGFVIASIHEKRDQLRDQIMQEGELSAKPALRSSSLRDREGVKG